MNVPAGGTASVTLTVTGTPTPSVSCAVNGGGTVQLSGSVVTYSAPSTVPLGGQATIACTATNPAGSAEATVAAKISAPRTQAAPQISVSQTNMNVPAGGTASVTLTVTGTPTPSVSCAVNGGGTVQLSGSVVTYSAPSTVPLGGQATVHVQPPTRLAPQATVAAKISAPRTRHHQILISQIT